MKENILFGSVYDAARYRSVVDSCSMTHDLEMLPHGDNTVIGDRGVNLSGGQKARIGTYSHGETNSTDNYISL